MKTRVEIDLNVRVRGNGTYVGFEDLRGPVAVGAPVEVFESESGLVGEGRVTEIDVAREIVFLSVDWGSLHDTSEQAQGVAAYAAGYSLASFLVAPWLDRGCQIGQWVRVERPMIAFSGYASLSPHVKVTQPGVVRNDALMVSVR